MFYNPAHYSNQLNLLSLNNHQLFETQNQNMAWITEKREAHLKQAATRCRDHLAKGNIVADFQAITTTSELSAEIAPLVRRIFRVFRVDPMTVRLIDLFDGSSYTLPRNLIKKLYITDIIHLICNEQAFQGEREFGP